MLVVVFRRGLNTISEGVGSEAQVIYGGTNTAGSGRLLSLSQRGLSIRWSI